MRLMRGVLPVQQFSEVLPPACIAAIARLKLKNELKEQKLQEKRRVAEIFHPGAVAPCSGVYKVVHALQHIAPHYVVVRHGDILPSCLECRDNVRFELGLSAVYVNAHPCFARH